MANIENLKPITTLSSEEAKKRGRAGGIASGKARQERKTMKETLLMCLQMKDEDGTSYQDLATIGLLKGAMKGNSNNYELILKLLGEIEDANRSKQDNELSKLDEILTEIKGEASK